MALEKFQKKPNQVIKCLNFRHEKPKSKRFYSLNRVMKELQEVYKKCDIDFYSEEFEEVSEGFIVGLIYAIEDILENECDTFEMFEEAEELDSFNLFCNR